MCLFAMRCILELGYTRVRLLVSYYTVLVLVSVFDAFEETKVTIELDVLLVVE